MQHSIGIIASSQAAGGGGGGDYIPKWVHNDGSVFLSRALPLVGNPTPNKFLHSGWIANNGLVTAFGQTQTDNITFATAPNENTLYGMELADTSPFFAEFYSSGESANFVTATTANVYPITTGTHIAVATDLDALTQQIAINGSVVSSGPIGSQPTLPFAADWGSENTLNFYQGWFPISEATVDDRADHQLWIGQTRDLSDPAVMALLMGDPALAAAAFGPQQVLFSGDKNGFIVNQGDAGAFAIYTNYLSDVVAGPGPGPITVAGAVVGQVVHMVTDTSHQHTSAFESVISVDGQIQQTSDDDFTGDQMMVTVVGGSLTDVA